jgi:hypothetical protein
MKRFWLTGLLICSATMLVHPSPAFGASDPEDIVVKVISYKDGTKIHYEGSGILVQYHKAVYVLTSEHVVLHDNDPGTHIEFQLDGKNPHEATYINSDWGMGLALLKAVDGITSDTFPDLEVLANATSPQIHEQAISTGFPVHSKSLIVDVDGKVSSTTNISMVLADVEQMLEIQGAHGEFGMSGGPVLDHDLVPIGILSHETPDTQNKILYAVPISVASQWAIHFITDPNAKPRLVRNSIDFVWYAGVRVRTERLIIDWYQKFDENNLQRVELGWDDTLQEPGLNPPTEPYPAPLFQKTMSRIAPWLKDGHDVGSYAHSTVTMFRPSDITRFEEMKPPATFVEFFRKAKDPRFEAMAQFSPNHKDWYWYADRYCGLGQGIDRRAYNLNAKRLRPALVAIGELTSCIDTTGQGGAFKTKYPAEALGRDDIESVLNDPEYKSDWENLKVNDKFTYDELQDDLKLIEEPLADRNL